jgi:hypothetical protein
LAGAIDRLLISCPKMRWVRYFKPTETPVSVQVDGLGPGCRRAESMSNPATPPDPLKAAAERDESAPSSQAPEHRNHTQTQTQHHKRNTSHEVPPNPIARLLD